MCLFAVLRCRIQRRKKEEQRQNATKQESNGKTRHSKEGFQSVLPEAAVKTASTEYGANDKPPDKKA